MDNLGAFFTVFFTVFLAEIGDKTQLATMLFATRQDYSKTAVFLAASLALTLAALFGVLAGTIMETFMPKKLISILAGSGFIIIGLLILIKGQ